eukprot:3302662-Amphidinium_carterae.2
MAIRRSTRSAITAAPLDMPAPCCEAPTYWEMRVAYSRMHTVAANLRNTVGMLIGLMPPASFLLSGIIRAMFSRSVAADGVSPRRYISTNCRTQEAALAACKSWCIDSVHHPRASNAVPDFRRCDALCNLSVDAMRALVICDIGAPMSGHAS